MSATVQTVALHLRAQPSIEAQIRAWLEKDQELQIVGRNADGRWLRCNTEDGVSGWVFTAHVILDGALEDLPVVE